MTIIKGSVGITRNTSVKRFSTWSQAPPRYAAVTPMTTDTAVAKTPATTASSSDSRVLQTSCEKMSCPLAAVPRRCWIDGGSRASNCSECGSYGARTGAKIDTTVKSSSTASPASALRLDMRLEKTLRRTPARGSTGSAISWLASAGTAIALRRLASPWIEPGGQHVGDQHRHQHRHGDEQEQRLHQREVLAVDGLQQHEAEPRVVEDDLDEDRAADHKSERHRESGEVGQDGVASCVLQHYPER